MLSLRSFPCALGSCPASSIIACPILENICVSISQSRKKALPLLIQLYPLYNKSQASAFLTTYFLASRIELDGVRNWDWQSAELRCSFNSSTAASPAPETCCRKSARLWPPVPVPLVSIPETLFSPMMSSAEYLSFNCRVVKVRPTSEDTNRATAIRASAIKVAAVRRVLLVVFVLMSETSSI